MHLRIIVLFSLTAAILSTAFTHSQSVLKAELVNISYYSKCDCSEDKPILIRIKYRIQESDIENLMMKHMYDGGITTSIPVKEFDKDGSIVYGLCMSEADNKRFTTVFYDAKGRTSNPIPVHINTETAEIINGTAPMTITK